MPEPRVRIPNDYRISHETVRDELVRPKPNGPPTQLFGWVHLVQAYHITSGNPGGYPPYEGTWALVELRDQPGKTIAVVTTSERLQSLLQTGISTGFLISISARQDFTPPLPLGGSTDLDVYELYEVNVYNFK